jgi:hypothetical protein
MSSVRCAPEPDSCNNAGSNLLVIAARRAISLMCCDSLFDLSPCEVCEVLDRPERRRDRPTVSGRIASSQSRIIRGRSLLSGR